MNLSVRSRTLLAGAITVPALMLASSCSGSASVGSTDPEVSQSDVEEQVAQAYTDQGVTGAEVACPGPLKGEVDAILQCDTTTDGGRSQATVTVTSVEGTDVKFDIESVPVLSAEETATKVSAQLADQLGQPVPPEVTCPGDLVGTIGTTMVCRLTDAGSTYDTTLTVTADPGDTIGFDIEVADSPS